MNNINTYIIEKLKLSQKKQYINDDTLSDEILYFDYEEVSFPCKLQIRTISKTEIIEFHYWDCSTKGPKDNDDFTFINKDYTTKVVIDEDNAFKIFDNKTEEDGYLEGYGMVRIKYIKDK